jgi:acid phosphatase type 7
MLIGGEMTIRLFAATAVLLLSCPAAADEVFVGAGDIAVCGGLKDEQTADLLDGISGTVFALGDNVYEFGTTQEFVDCYEPSWGRHKTRTKPVAGNHEYLTDAAQPYRDYFDVPRNYSYELGDWHIVALDSNCDVGGNGGCGLNDPTVNWLRAELELNSQPCTLVYFHHARWSSNLPNGGVAKMQPAWEVMSAAGVDVVLAAHSHSYERFAPLDARGAVDVARGIRSFVVGTGGARLKPFRSARRGSVVRNGSTHGVLKLTLQTNGYLWQFIPVAGRTFTDSGSGTCH